MTDQLIQGEVNDYSAPVAMVCILITRMVNRFLDISQFYFVLEQTLYYSFTWNEYPYWYDGILGSQYYYCLPKSNTCIIDEPTNPIRIIEEMCSTSKVKNLTAESFLCCETNDSNSLLQNKALLAVLGILHIAGLIVSRNGFSVLCQNSQYKYVNLIFSRPLKISN